MGAQPKLHGSQSVSAKLLIPFYDSRFDIFYGQDVAYTNHIKMEQERAFRESLKTEPDHAP